MNVMKRAWEIAKEGQKKFGGKIKEYFAEALKLAWAECFIYLQDMRAFRSKKVRKGVMEIKVSTVPPVTVGSEKQINWANKIREQFNCEVHNLLQGMRSDVKERYGRELPAKAYIQVVESARALFINKNDAAFWINNRDEFIGKLITQFNKELAA